MTSTKQLINNPGVSTIEFKGVDYPMWQASGNAARFAIPFAIEVCKGGVGYDVGCNRPSWALPGAIPIDPSIDSAYDAMHLPDVIVDYFFSSHMLEHYVGRFQDVIEYWLTRLKKGGVIMLYLPNCDYQKYWAWGNTKHIHYLNPTIMRDYLNHLDGIEKFFVTSGYDLNGSFYCVIQK